jgi:hypothetical protein
MAVRIAAHGWLRMSNMRLHCKFPSQAYWPCLPLDWELPALSADGQQQAQVERCQRLGCRQLCLSAIHDKSLPKKAFEFAACSGSPTWTRTRDLRINSPSLYQLSYQGKEAILYTATIAPSSAGNTFKHCHFAGIQAKKILAISRKDFFFILAPRPGLEPGTCGLTVRRSTN